MNAKKVYEIFRRFQQHEATPTTELQYATPFELLIAVMLSAQATDISVNKATAKLFKIANTPKEILALGVDKLKTYIQTINLYPTKAVNIIKTCQLLVEKYDSQVPNNREALESFPGVGRKTASVVLNTAFGEREIAVDTHIFRVANRTHLAPGKNVLAVEKKLLAVVPDEFIMSAHHWLLLHGRYVCVARKPKCPTCIIRDLCEYKDKTKVL